MPEQKRLEATAESSMSLAHLHQRSEGSLQSRWQTIRRCAFAIRGPRPFEVINVTLFDFGPNVSERLSRRSRRLQVCVENMDGIVQEACTFRRQANAAPEFEHPDEFVRSELEGGR